MSRGIEGTILVLVVVVLGAAVAFIGRSATAPRAASVATAPPVPETAFAYPVPWTQGPAPTLNIPPATPYVTPAYPIPPTATFPPPPPQPTPRASDPYHLTVAAEPSYWQPDDMTKFAPIVIVGAVTKVHPPRWTTPDGTRPSNPWTTDNRETIYKPVEITVTQYLKGAQQQQRLLIFAVGGTIGQDSVAYSPEALLTFHEGEQVVLFLIESRYSLEDIVLLNVVDHYTITSDSKAKNYFQTVPQQQLLDAVRSAAIHLTPTSQ